MSGKASGTVNTPKWKLVGFGLETEFLILFEISFSLAT